MNKQMVEVFSANGWEVHLIATDNQFLKLPLWVRLFAVIVGLPARTAYLFNKLNKEHKYDVVIANGEFAFGLRHPRIINLFHGCYHGYGKALARHSNFLQKLNLARLATIQKVAAKRSYRVVAVSNYIANFLKEQGIVTDAVIPNGVDTNVFFPSSVARENYLFVGSSYYGKGIDVLEKIAVKIAQPIDCVTSCEVAPPLIKQGSVKNDMMPQLYNRHRILVFPSRYEGMQMAPLEAMACGLPVLISDVGFYRELAQHEQIFVLPLERFAEEAPRRLAEIEASYDHYSMKSRSIVKAHFDINAFANRWTNFVTETCNG